MSENKLLDFLQSFGVMSAGQAVAVARSFQRRQVARNEVLLRPGEVSNEYLVMESGLVRAFVHDAEGEEVTTGFYSVGQVAVEVSSFFSRTPAQEQLQALADCTGWYVTYEQLNALFHTRPEFREFGRLVLVRALTRLKARLLSQARDSAAVRYDRLVRDSPDILQHAPLRHVASYLGITDSSLSRIRTGVRAADAA